MQLRFRVTMITIFLLVAAGITLVVDAPASADATSGTCKRGFKLESYSYTYRARNSSGRTMWDMTFKQRWCYSRARHMVGSHYSPRPKVRVFGAFESAWQYGGIHDKDVRYSSRGPRGENHPRYQQYSHRAGWEIKMRHCIFLRPLCDNYYYTGGIIAYWDGSKKIYKPPLRRISGHMQRFANDLSGE